MSIPQAFKDFGVIKKYQLAPLTYMKVGGIADYFYQAKSRDDLVKIINAAHQANMPVFIIGGGSNILFSDDGFRGLVIKNRADHILADTNNPNRLIVESGTIVNQLVRHSLNANLAGLEEFLGIPGTVGGAVYNNSHHLSHLIGDYIHSVEVVTREGVVKVLSQKDMNFAYDYSILQKTHDIVLTVTFALTPGDGPKLWELAQKALKRRRDTQPLEMPSSGCMFKNIGRDNAVKFNTPEGATAAGYLIDKAGLKGYTIGGAQVSDKHANFIVNLGNAKSSDIKNLSDHIINVIRDKFGVTLEREVFIIPPVQKY